MKQDIFNLFATGSPMKRMCWFASSGNFSARTEKIDSSLPLPIPVSTAGQQLKIWIFRRAHDSCLSVKRHELKPARQKLSTYRSRTQFVDRNLFSTTSPVNLNGYELTKFSNCCHTGNMVNFNGQPYSFQDDDWVLQEANIVVNE